jgi:hypothetical protein
MPHAGMVSPTFTTHKKISSQMHWTESAQLTAQCPLLHEVCTHLVEVEFKIKPDGRHRIVMGSAGLSKK